MTPYSWFRFLFFACICINHAFSKSETGVSYTKHCQSVIPLYNVTARGSDNALPSLSTPYFTGGESLLRTEPGRTYYYVQKNLRLRLRSDHYETTAAGVSKVEGFLYIRFPYSSDDAQANYSYGGYNRRRNRRKASIRFPVNGYWSEKSRKLCMVGSASWRGIDRDAVLKLKFDDENRMLKMDTSAWWGAESLFTIRRLLEKIVRLLWSLESCQGNCQKHTSNHGSSSF